jgi:hypothetical protein
VAGVGVYGADTTMEISVPEPRRDPWNKGRLIGEKRPLKPKNVWTIRVRLQMEDPRRESCTSLAAAAYAIAWSRPRPNFPASALITVAGLARPEMLVEVQGIAVLG